MNLQEILGESYSEDMTIADVQNALNAAGHNFVDLSQGGYVDKNKFDREVGKLQGQVNTLTNEKAAAQNAQKDADNTSAADKAQIQSLQEQLKQLGIENNKQSAVAKMAATVELLGIKDTDVEYNTFIESVSKIDKDDATSMTDYFAKQVKAAYEKGKQDATKNSMGELGKKHGSSEKEPDAKGNLGKQLAALSATTGKSSYFKR